MNSLLPTSLFNRQYPVECVFEENIAFEEQSQGSLKSTSPGFSLHTLHCGLEEIKEIRTLNFKQKGSSRKFHDFGYDDKKMSAKMSKKISSGIKYVLQHLNNTVIIKFNIFPTKLKLVGDSEFLLVFKILGDDDPGDVKEQDLKSDGGTNNYSVTFNPNNLKENLNSHFLNFNDLNNPYRLDNGDNSAITLNFIINTVKSSLTFIDDTRDLWNELQDRYSQQNDPQIFRLKRTLASLTQDQDLVSVYYEKLEVLWDKLSIYDPIAGCSYKILKVLLDRYQRDSTQHKLGTNVPVVEFMALATRRGHVDGKGNYKHNVSTKQNWPYCTFCKASGHTFEISFKVGNAKLPICTHYNMKGHLAEKCYKLDGYPSGHKLLSILDHNWDGYSKALTCIISSSQPSFNIRTDPSNPNTNIFPSNIVSQPQPEQVPLHRLTRTKIAPQYLRVVLTSSLSIDSKVIT
ncbi:Retrotransposon gag domain [Dillenia turbinata]|uniref:Retrotransposon gag domain n=1 Tax=Dillenia turbinata TaxID=194707 RepID=A0AAN8VF31_9MAGN